MSNHVVAFIKFVEKQEYVKDFLAGHLYCNTLEHFVGVENSQQGDQHETTTAILNKPLYPRLAIKNVDDFLTPIFCLYSVFLQKQRSSVGLNPSELLKSGNYNYGVVIKDVGEFIKRLDQLPGFSYGLVEYLDFDNLTGQNKYAFENPFLKKDAHKFSHQQEFRIYNNHLALTNDLDIAAPSKETVPPNERGAKIFSIGSLQDIADVYTTAELFSGTISTPIIVNNWNLLRKQNLSRLLWWNGNQYQSIRKSE